ncbi:hypothetical protein DFP97_10992 [Paenibacillus prosopidis]|uniref:Uncharacterized protein n=1 Tax=Paenibacillus prosopidis TaxID=630520 RepID=A0A368VZW9_9BACL|nr:hypothetical protein DFP97_10992 [Paenibacillus prosopidis]
MEDLRREKRETNNYGSDEHGRGELKKQRYRQYFMLRNISWFAWIYSLMRGCFPDDIVIPKVGAAHFLNIWDTI